MNKIVIKNNQQEDPFYREVILEHWNNPQNYGKVKDPDFSVDDNNPSCGDSIHLTGKIENGKLIAIKFTGEGCAISKASASIYTEKIKGMEIDEIRKITPEEVLAELGLQLTPARMKCALLVYSTLQSTKPFHE